MHFATVKTCSKLHSHREVDWRRLGLDVFTILESREWLFQEVLK